MLTLLTLEPDVATLSHEKLARRVHKAAFTSMLRYSLLIWDRHVVVFFKVVDLFHPSLEVRYSPKCAQSHRATLDLFDWAPYVWLGDICHRGRL